MNPAEYQLEPVGDAYYATRLSDGKKLAVYSSTSRHIDLMFEDDDKHDQQYIAARKSNYSSDGKIRYYDLRSEWANAHDKHQSW